MKRELVTMRLGREAYAVDMSSLVEVRRCEDIMHIPGAPSFIEGVIRTGDVLAPVLDLKKRFKAMGPGEGRRKIMVLELGTDHLGVIVDHVTGMINIDVADCEPFPAIVFDSAAGRLIGQLIKTGQGLIIEILPGEILDKNEMQRLRDFEKANGQEKK